MVAFALINGRLTAEAYEDEAAADPRIDALRARIEVIEETAFSKDYLDPEKRSIANAMQVFFADGSRTAGLVSEYPLGHRRRRVEGIPVLNAKFRTHLASRFSVGKQEAILTSSLSCV